MGEDPIAVLLAEDVWEQERTPRWLVAGGMLALAAGVAAAWWLLGGEAGDEAAAPPTAATTTSSATSPTTAAPPRHDLVAFTTDPLVLNLPTVLPAGWERCGRARLCDPGDPSRAVSRRTLQSRPAGAAPTGVPGLVYLPGDAVEIAVVFPTTAGIAFRGAGIGRDDLLRVVSSVPIAGDWSMTIPAEPALADEPPAEMVADVAGVSVDDVATSFGTFRVDLLDLDVNAWPIDRSVAELTLEVRADVAAWVDPVSVSEARSLIVGGRGSFSRAVWVQRGYHWSIFSNMDVVGLTALVRRLEAAIAELP